MKTKDIKKYTIKGDGLVHDAMEISNEHYRGFGLGVEVEFFTVDETSLVPTDYSSLIMDLPEFGKTVTPEFPTELVELNTPPHQSLDLLLKDLVQVTNKVKETISIQGGKLLPLAFYDVVPQEDGTIIIPHEFKLNMNERYETIVDVFGEPLKEHASRVASLQVNVGADNEEQAFKIFNGFRQYLPFIMAISAASPFKEGKPNDIVSNRLDAYDLGFTQHSAFTGIPPELANLQEYAAFVESMPAFQHPGRIYNYARPMPQRGVAAEIRCMDMQPTIADSMAMTALTKAITFSILDSPPLDNSFLNVSFQHARRYGIDDKESSHRLLSHFSAFLDSGEQKYLQPLFDRLETGTPANKLVTTYHQSGLMETYHQLANNFEN